jgi:NADPH:quinone reductase
MLALAVDHGVASRLALTEVPDVVADPHQILVQVAATSVNFGELPSPATPQGSIPGWEAAGFVTKSPTANPAFEVGHRVVTWGLGGGWAQYRAASVTDTAVIPDGVDLAEAATLPVAGVTALRALRAAGSVLNRNVMITGASGGVGGFAVQLAVLSGACVTAVATDPEQAAALRALGAAEVVSTVTAASRPADIVLDNVGGAALGDAVANIAVGGRIFLIGAASWRPTQLTPMALTMKKAQLIGFQKGPDVAADLTTLLDLVAAGRLDTRIAWRGDWSRVHEVVEAYGQRRLKGKAVLEVS